MIVAKCKQCGRMITDGSTFCPYCGEPVKSSNEPEYDLFRNGSKEAKSYSLPQKSMGWYHFLINFWLWLEMIYYVIYGFIIMFGVHYGNRYLREYIYRYYSGLRALDIFIGLCCIGLAVLAVKTRQALANWRENGPTLLYLFYIVGIVSSILYIILFKVITKLSIQLTSFWISFAIAFGFFVFNLIYFSSRRDMFNYRGYHYQKDYSPNLPKGLLSDSSDKPVDKPWRCRICGNTNPSYVGTCGCGNAKPMAMPAPDTRQQPKVNTERWKEIQAAKQGGKESPEETANQVFMKDAISGSLPASVQTMDKFAEVKAYKELLDSGILSQEEFDKKKAELLGL